MADDDISDAEIAVMCDIARVSGLDLDADKQAVLDGLIAKGMVEPTGGSGPGPKFAVTARAQRLLDKRGVGVNEA
jgi:hypothetical protein